IVVDSNSNDGTLEICKGFLSSNKNKYPTCLLSEKERLGKSHALNTALDKATGEIIATSDADSFWESNALVNAVVFFSNPCVGAVTGKETLSNVKKSIHTLSEGMYRKFYYTLRLGESKIFSTLIFQGELSLYRRNAFKKFEDKAGCSDDVGTIMNMIQNGYRCIFTPDAVFCDTAAISLSGRLALKSRRSEHLIAGVTKALRLKFAGKFEVPWRIVFFNFYLHVISPIILLFTGLVTIGAFIIHFSSIWFLLLLGLLLVFKKIRLALSLYLTSNMALLIGITRIVRGKRSTSWKKIDEMR
ncbi:MAG: glycosyltransferase, partial [Clostridiales bacterium]|nr:glycosyltransferase [Clostridiales bacterium]